MKSWWKWFKKLSLLPLSDQLLLAQTFVVVGLIKVGLKVLSFQRFRNVYSALTKATKDQEINTRLIERRIWAIRKVSGPLLAVCLPQALALTCFLRKDRAVTLVVGVRKAEAFEAHAWVEKNGKTLIGQLPDATFQPLWIWQ